MGQVANTIQLRRDTAAAFTTANPTLAPGEPAYETDTRKLKVGNGTTPWASLPYFDFSYTLPPATASVLGGVKIGANITVLADGTISVADPYVHPASHPPSIITQDLNNRFVTDAQISLWNGKLDASHAGTGGTAHAAVTTTVNGFMIAADKSKLDGIAANANNYVHPTGDGNLHVIATSTTNNGRFLTAGATAGSLSWTTPPNVVAGGASGYMTGADKTKLDGIASGANNYTLPIASGTVLGGIKVGTGLAIDAGGILSTTGGGSTYTLPPATTTTLGGIIVGNNLTVDADGRLHAAAGGSSKPQAALLTHDTVFGNNTTADQTFISMLLTPAQMAAGTIIKGEMWGQHDVGTTASNLELWVKIGGTKYIIVNAANGTTAATLRLMLLKVMMTIRTTGTTGQVTVNGRGRVNTTDSHMGNISSITTNTTADVLFELGATFTVAGTAYNLRPRQAALWVQ